jgi:uncharacterized protein YegP (UPF0339 family)
MAKKFPYILIKDAKNGFRTQLVGGNGEPLMTSEVLETPKAVKINLLAVELATTAKDFQANYSKSDSMSALMMNDIRYTGKSKAIYKLFQIATQGS